MTIDTGSILHAAPAVGAATAATAMVRPRQLSQAAAQAAAARVAPAYSPIVVAGFVRMAEFAFIALLGIAVYFAYVYPAYGHALDWYYLATAIGIAVLAVVMFQAADIYHVQAFRSPISECIRLVAAWSLVSLMVAAIVFFAKLGDLYSRLWLAGYYGIGLVALVGFRFALYGLIRRWTQEGRLDRRAVVVGGGEPGEALITALDRQQDSRREPGRRVRRPRR